MRFRLKNYRQQYERMDAETVPQQAGVEMTASLTITITAQFYLMACTNIINVAPNH